MLGVPLAALGEQKAVPWVALPEAQLGLAMPARGRIGILFGSWYTDPIVGRVFGRLKSAAFDAELERIVALERMLTDDGVLLHKIISPRNHVTKRYHATLSRPLVRPLAPEMPCSNASHSLAIARARATRFCMPPESSEG